MKGMTRSQQDAIDALSPEQAELFRLLVGQDSNQSRKITRQQRNGEAFRAPTSWAQQRLWFLDKVEGGSSGYYVPLAVRIRGRLHENALETALRAMVQRHEALRTTFIDVDGEPCQWVQPAQSFDLSRIDLTGCTKAEREDRLRSYEGEEAHRPFNLETGPLIRGCLIRLEAEEYVLLVTMHHIVSDGWSMGVFARELGSLYDAFRANRSDPLPPVPVQYSDYAHWQRQWLQGDLLKKQLNYWVSRLQGAEPTLALPTDRDRPPVQSFRGGDIPLVLDAELYRKVQAFSRHHQVTVFMTLYAAWAIFLWRVSGQEDVVVGTPVANRPSPELEGLIGFFVNTLALRVDVKGDLSLDEFLARIKETTLGAYDHQDAPFERLVEVLQPQRGLGHHPIFQVMIAFNNASQPGLSLGELSVTTEEDVTEPAMFDLSLSLQDHGDEILGNLNYALDLFDRQTVERWLQVFKTILGGMTDGGHACVGDIPVLSESEKLKVTRLFNATETEYSRGKGIHQLFESQVARSPDAIAVISGDEGLSYLELDRKATELAQRLRAKGVGPGQLVAIFIERSVEMVIGLLGILKAGGAYVPLDPAYPSDRVAFTLTDARASVLLTRRSLIDKLPAEWVGALLLLDDDVGGGPYELTPPKAGFETPRPGDADLAYVIYTSGSTGQPKGVMVEHQNVVNLLQAHARNCSLTYADRVLQFASFAFDSSIEEIFTPLIVGAAVVLRPNDVFAPGDAFTHLLRQQSVTVAELPTAFWHQWVDDGEDGPDPEALRLIVVGGEKAERRRLETWRRSSVGRRCNWLNSYGPTEATVYSTALLIEPHTQLKTGEVAIGFPVANTQIYILDPQGLPVPIGVSGEIYIGGEGVARGYLNRPELTAERFRADVYGNVPSSRMYRTGDLGRWRPDGTLEYLGRNDNQVKIRGFRIEPGEIESRLKTHDRVVEALVIARNDDRGQLCLVAYIVPRVSSDGSAPEIADLRAHLQASLPQHMIPAAFVVLDRIPLTPTGKLDRKALPAPTPEAYISRGYEAPVGEIEQILAGIWQQLLKVERVSRNDNFFELGGHSLLIARLMERLRRVGLSTDIRNVFQSRTLADLARVLGRETVRDLEIPPNRILPASERITPDMLPLVSLETEHIEHIVRTVPGGTANIQDVYPLSPLQEGMLFHHLLELNQGDAYVQPVVFRLSSREQREKLILALQRMIDRHDILRTAILWESLPRPLQVVYREVSLPVVRLEVDGERNIEAQISEWLLPERQRMDLRQAPLLRLQVTEVPHEGSWYALVQLHHLACDHESLETLFSEIMACLKDPAQELPRVLPYRNHLAHVLAAAGRNDSQEFFRRKLSDVEELTAPYGVTGLHVDGTAIAEAFHECEPGLVQRVRAQARACGVSTATIFHAAWAMVVAGTSARDDVVFGTVLLGRMQGAADTQSTLGMFINTLPLRLKLSGVTVRELIEQTQRELVELLSHEHASLAEAQRCSGIKGAPTLFTALFNYRHSVSDILVDWEQETGIKLYAGLDRTNYPITVSVDDFENRLVIEAQTDHRIDPRRLAVNLNAAVRNLVLALESEPHTLALAVSILSQEERITVLESFNTTQQIILPETTVHGLFEEQAQQTPHAVAVIHESSSLTFAELDRRANLLAQQLSGRILPGSPVGICCERGIEMIVGVVAILKSGGAYVPLDPNYPPERLRHMIEDASPAIILTQNRLRGLLPESKSAIICLDSPFDREFFSRAGAHGSPPVSVTPQSPVYIIYTSGSTGRPKGTALAHRSMVNLIEWHRNEFGDGRGRRVLQFAALSFDVAFQEIFSTLCTGGTLVLLDEWVRRDVSALRDLLDGRFIERIFLPPLMLQSLAQHIRATGFIPSALRDVITAGEQLSISPEIVHVFSNLPLCRLHNHYGPTESHVVTALTLSGSPERWPSLPPIGRPIPNARIYVLNAQREPVPVGAVGEIFIGGVCVALGYFQRPDLTADRFVTDPFARAGLERLYRTGDIGRWTEQGVLEYLGRNDEQVKIRGYRVELHEIEARLLQHERVKEAAVVAREDTAGGKRLAAYIIARHPDQEPAAEQLRAYLKERLPEHMIPSAFVFLPRLPLTPSGKLDRRALPKPDDSAYVSRAYEAPFGEVEEILAGIWQQILRIERIGRRDNFFELGGHSLLIVQMMERLRAIGLATTVRTVYGHPVLADLAAALMGEKVDRFVTPPSLIPPGCEAITPQMLPLIELDPVHIRHIETLIPGGARNIQDIYPLAPLQEGMLFHHVLTAGRGDAYVLPILLTLESREMVDRLVEALRKVISRHDILRTAILWDKLPRPVQVVLREVEWAVEELTLDQHQDPLEDLGQKMRPERQRLDLRTAPMMRLIVTPAGVAPRWHALLQLHHMIGDHESLEIVLAEVAAYIEGWEGVLPDPIPYRIHVAQALAHANTQESEAFFSRKLGEIEETTAPFGLIDVHGDGSRIRDCREGLEERLSKRLRSQARQLGVSAATLFHAAWSLVVGHTSAREDVVFGTVLLGRLQGSAGAQRVLGMFINTLPLRLRLKDVTAKELVEQVQRELVELLGHEQASLAVAQRCSAIPGSAPLFTALLNYRHSAATEEVGLGGVAGIDLVAIQDRTNYPVTLSVDDMGDGFVLDVQTDCSLDAHRVAVYVSTALESLVEALEKAPRTPALSLSILPAREREEILEQFNARRSVYPQQKLVHELFEEQVARTPGQTAVVYEGQSLSYEQLNARANQLAHGLRERGVGPDQRVGICMERSLEMVVGLLGILKAGAAYVPMDPAYPPERLAYMLADAAPAVLLTQGRLKSGLPSTGAEVISLDEDWDQMALQPGSNLSAQQVGVDDHHLAYVIYTSGSTGMPKGAMNEHRGVVNRLQWMQEQYRLDETDRVLQKTPFSFDVSVWEFFWTLMNGARLVVARPEGHKDPGYLRQLIQESGVTRVHFVPSMLQIFLEQHRPGDCSSLRQVVCSGEELPAALQKKCLESLPQARLSNLYGPTEAAVDVTAWECERDDSPVRVPIGRPISNVQMYVLDRQKQPLPIGVSGEIYIGGVGVGRGYLNRPQLTAERFVSDPFSADGRSRLYRTGDLGRWRADGALEYLGRNDHQVKIRGFRIELGEIEAQLSKLPQVKEAAVIAREDVAGDKRLVAYVALREAGADPQSVEGLRRQLKDQLPEYMVPGAFVLLEQLPLTPNGKLDRRALPAPELGAYVSREYQAPQGEVEEILAGIWQGLLRVERVGRHDNFFELGGHSLQLMRLTAAVSQTLKRKLSISAVFRYPTITALASAISYQSFLEAEPEGVDVEFEEGLI
jgi:amino acid adenylation domain-containing protein